jgi:natural product precursor
MKKIKFSKKLQLNKETIANLNNDEMNKVKGGTGSACLSVCGSCPKVCQTILDPSCAC